MFRAVLPRLVRPARFLCSVEGRQPVKVCIVGSGPAAYTAAIYASRALLKPIVFEGFMAGGIAAGGQLTTTTEVENYPGFPAGIGGPELMAQMREQALRCGAHILTETVVKVNVGSRPFEVHGEDGTALSAESLIIATGATAKRMNLPGEETYWQRGVSACAVCDGALPLFRNQELLVVGGGDSACEEATYLSKYGSRVRMLVRRGELRASKVMRTRAEQNPKVEIVYNTIPTEVLGDGKKLTSVMVQDTRTGERRELPAAGLFLCHWAPAKHSFPREAVEH
eukprot:TRINITY_DN6918_c0_g1_i2.p1 TRINITY_DN6918_c0_g1~~TRINITY_DN6918_c0_g1_i2.p1  ORF type:complete len:282 (+),score=31.58 TRINITY_DN6918_c0_g1_i2:30-875(+)